MDLQQALLAVLTVASGYAALRVCPYTALRWRAQSWDQNFFESGAIGALLFVSARLAKYVPMISTTLEQARPTLSVLAPVPYAASFLGALLLGCSLSLMSGWVLSRERLVGAAVERHGDDLEKLLHRALQDGVPVMLSLESRKVYMGYVLSTPSLFERDRHTRVFTLKSGHRTAKDQRIHWTTNYAAALEAIGDREDNGVSASEIWSRGGESRERPRRFFGTVVPLDQVVSATLFDEELQAWFAASESASH